MTTIEAKSEFTQAMEVTLDLSSKRFSSITKRFVYKIDMSPSSTNTTNTVQLTKLDGTVEDATSVKLQPTVSSEVELTSPNVTIVLYTNGWWGIATSPIEIGKKKEKKRE